MPDNKIEFLPTNVASCCTTETSKVMLEGCANGVSYLVIVCDSDCGQTTSLKYLNLSTGAIESNPPADFTLGNCDDKIATVACKPYLETETFVATAGQTFFPLSKVPSGDVRFSRNGSTLSDGSAVVIGQSVSYVASANNSEVLLANDRIDISYIYVVCNESVEPYVDCIGNELASGSALVTCAALNPNQFSIDPTTGEVSVVSSGGIVLNDCLGNALTTGDGIVKCDALNPNQFSIDPTTGQITVVTTNLTDCVGNDLTKDTAVITCASLNPSDFNIDPNTGLISTVDYTDCVGNELGSGTSLVTCAALNPNQFSINPTTGQISVGSGLSLTDCIGNPIVSGESVVKCEALNPTYFTIDPTTGIISPVNAATITRAGVYATFENKTILPNTLTQITAYNTVSDTSAGAWNSAAGTFTAPRAGWYDITANVSTLISAWIAGSENTIAIYKNGVRVIAGTNWFHTSNGNPAQTAAYAHQAIAAGKLYLNAGDVIDIRHFHTSTTAKTTWTAERSNVSIVELGTTL